MNINESKKGRGMKHKLIITADDYGMCESVNRAIDACIAAGVVCSTNVMTNMECAQEAAALKEKFTDISVGLHYNFTVGKPISPAEKVRSLIDEDGTFLSYGEIRNRQKQKRYIAEEVSLEMEAQYKRYVEICGEPDYWNTHENVHVYPGAYQLFRDKSLELGITKMRSHQRIFVPAANGITDKSLKWKITNPAKQAMLNIWQNESRKLGVSSPDGLLVRMNEIDKLHLEYMFNNIQWKNCCVAEIAIHPAMDGESPYFGEITTLRVKEYECFSRPEVISIAASAGVDIAGFEVVGA